MVPASDSVRSGKVSNYSFIDEFVNLRHEYHEMVVKSPAFGHCW
jgi:hypothetical protein